MAENKFAVNILFRARDGVSRAVRGMRGQLGRLNNTVTQVGGALGLYFGGRAVIDFFTGSAKSAADFEQALDRVGAVSGATDEEMQKLRDTARELGQNTTFKSEEVVAGLEELTRSGYSAAQAIESIPSVVHLAEASQLNLANASQIVSDNLRIFNQSADQSGRFADVLANASSRASGTVQQFGRAMSYAGPVAASAGEDFESTAGALEILHNNGLKGERAGTALRGIFGKLQDTGSQTRKTLRELGIDTGDLGEVLDGIGELSAPKAKEAIAAFGLEAMPAVTKLVDEGSAALRENAAALEESGGKAQSMAEQVQDNLNGALDRLGSAWNTLRQKLLKPVLPELREQVQDLAETFREWVDSGVIKQFGQDLASAFGTGAEKARSFMGAFDPGAIKQQWDKITQTVRASTARVTGLMETISGAFGTVLNAGRTLGSGLGAVAYKIGNAFSSVADGAFTILEAVNIVSAETAKKVEEFDGYIEDMQGRYQERIKSDAAATVDSMGTLFSGATQFATGTYQQATDAARQSGDAQIEIAGEVSAAVAGSYKSWAKALSNVANGREANAAKERLREMFDAGDISRAKFEKGITQLNKRVQKLAKETADAGDAAKDMGKDADDGTDKAAGGAEEARSKFAQLEAQIEAASDASELEKLEKKLRTAWKNGKIGADQYAKAVDQTRGKLDKLSAQAGKVATAIDEASSTLGLREAQDKARAAFDQGALSAKQYAKVLGDIKAKRRELAQEEKAAAEETEKAARSQEKAADAADKAGNEAKEAGDQAAAAANKIGNAGQALAGVLAGAQQRMADLSKNALARFEDMRGFGNDAAEEADRLQRKLDEANQSLHEVQTAPKAGPSGVNKWLADTKQNAALTKKAFYEQKIEARDLARSINDGSVAVSDLGFNADNAAQRFDLLGKEDLGGLRDAITDAESRLASLEDSASSTIGRLRDELDQLEGDQQAIQEREYESRKAELKQKLEEARRLGSEEAEQQYQESLDLLEQVHQKRMADIRKENEEEKKRERERVRESADSSTGSGTGGGRGGAPSGTSTQQSGRPAPREIRLRAPDGEVASVSAEDGDQMDRFLEVLQKAGARTE